MTIHRPQGPVDGEDVVHRALNHLFADAPSTEAPLGGDTYQPIQPIPVFRVDLDRIRDISFLSQARPIGWRYLVDRNGPVAVADVRETSSGGVAFGRVMRGLPAKRLLRAAQLAADTYGGKVAGDYELRILDIPALHMSALWLHRGNSHQLAQERDVFFLIMSSQPKGEEVQEDSSFMEEVVCAATAHRQAPSEALAP